MVLYIFTLVSNFLGFLKCFRLNSETKIAIIFVLLICLVYLHPAFLGKIDTPLDIRNLQMYPWKYSAVDKKIIKHEIWKSENSLSLKLPPSVTQQFVFNLNNARSEKLEIDHNDRVNCYFSYDFKTSLSDPKELNIRPLFFNKDTGIGYEQKALVIRSYLDGNEKWYSTRIWINKFLQQYALISEINKYPLIFILKNENVNDNLIYNLKNAKLICEDHSRVAKMHNSYNNDLIQSFAPSREYFSSSLKKGYIPFWKNYSFTGIEFLAEPQSAFLHPIVLFVYFLFDHFTAHLVITFVCLFLCGIGSYFLCRYWNMDFFPSIFTSIVYMFHPFNAVWFSFEHMLINSATLPFLILSFEKRLNEKTLINKYFLFSALLLGSLFLSGHLQHVYYAVFLFMFFVLFRLCFTKESLFRKIFCVLFIHIIGLMLASVILLPFFQMFFNSYRTAWSDAVIRANSFPLNALLGLFSPFYKGVPEWPISNFTAEYLYYAIGFSKNYIYFGFIPCLLFLFSFFNILKNRLILFFVVTILISFLICTGSPLFFLVKDIIPGFQQLQHQRFLQVYSYCVPFLAGFGLQFVSNAIAFLKSRIKSIIFIVIVVITAIDLMFHASYFVTWFDRKEYNPVPNKGIIEYLKIRQSKSKKPFRVLPFISKELLFANSKMKIEMAPPDSLSPYGIEEISGYHSLIPKDLYALYLYTQTKDISKLYSDEISDVYTNPNIPYPLYSYQSMIFDLLNVKYFLVPNTFELDEKEATKVFSAEGCSIYKNKGSLPRAFFVPNYKIIKSPIDTIVNLDSNNFNPYKEVVLMSSSLIVPASDLMNLSKNLKYKIEFIKNNANNIKLRIKTNQRGFLVLGSNLNDNWKVKINKKPARHFQANLVQRVVFLPKGGTYEVDYYYFPKLYIIGLLISMAAVLILVVMTGFTLKIPINR